MSPEQLRGETLDARSDLFSFGLVLYQMATGRPAFTGATSAMISAAILHETPATPRALRADLPARLEEVILKALEKDRTVRCQSASELRADLKRFARAPGLTDARDSEPRPIASPLSQGTPAPALTAPPPSSDAQIVASLMKRHQRGLVVAVVVRAGGRRWCGAHVAAFRGRACASTSTTAAVGQKSHRRASVRGREPRKRSGVFFRRHQPGTDQLHCPAFAICRSPGARRPSTSRARTKICRHIGTEARCSVPPHWQRSEGGRAGACDARARERRDRLSPLV